MKYRIIVAALIESNGKYLFGKKAPGVGPFPDKWLIPGGGVDLGNETLEEGLRREIREETGIEITQLRRETFKDEVGEKHGEEIYHVFLDYSAQHASGEITSGDDLVEVAWFGKEELATLDVADVTKDLLRHLELIS